MVSVELLTYKSDEVTTSAEMLLEREFSFPTVVTTIAPALETNLAMVAVDYYFDRMSVLRPHVETIVVFLTPSRLFTAFDHEIVAETRANRVVVATSKLTQATLPRVFRHEIGRVLGLSDHWGCVMSRYFVEDPMFCIQCRATLFKHGIAWRPNPGVQVSEKTLSP
jgi:hypothetical protein